MGPAVLELRGIRAGAQVTGAAAYQRVYRTVVTYLRDERGLDNLLFAFAPDRFGGPNDAAAGDVSRYLTGYPGDAHVDVLGIDPCCVGSWCL